MIKRAEKAMEIDQGLTLAVNLKVAAHGRCGLQAAHETLTSLP
jgi:hypothetical protein